MNRKAGPHGGVIGRSAIRLLETLLFIVWPGARICISPSLARLATLSRMSTRSVCTALRVLSFLYFITVRRRVKAVQTPVGTIMAQDSNAYEVHEPGGLGLLGRAVYAGRDRGAGAGAGLSACPAPDGKNFRANKNHLFFSNGEAR